MVLVLLTTVLIPLLLVAGWNDATDADDLSPQAGGTPSARLRRACDRQVANAPEACTPTWH